MRCTFIPLRCFTQSLSELESHTFHGTYCLLNHRCASWILSPIYSISAETSNSAETGLLADEEPFEQKLRRLVQQTIGIGGVGPTVHLMAELCQTSVRTLHRRLKESGTSYRELIDRVRYDLASERLANTDLTIKELAFDLGYSGANNFIRAFKRMNGFTPEQFRKKHS